MTYHPIDLPFTVLKNLDEIALVDGIVFRLKMTSS